MTILDDKIRIEGNSLVIRMQPATGLLALTSFVSNEVGTSATAHFDKYFRYTLNGILFNEWLPLTASSITDITVSPTDTLVIELSYLKIDEVEGESALGVESIEIEATKTTTSPQNFFDRTVFKEFFDSDSVEVLNWYVNVLDKLYNKGIIPNYIDRLNSNNQPDDFLDFWKSIARFFSYFVIYARKFQKFYESETLLSEYIEERGLRISVENNIGELDFLMRKFYQQISQRGTTNIVNKIEEGNIIDGELLRLIWYKSQDEFAFNLHKEEHFGWNLRNSSPLYRGLTLNDNLNKYGDRSFEPYDISRYSGATLVTDEGKSVLQVASQLGDIGNRLKVSPELDYEFSFLIKNEELATLTVQLVAYDKDLNIVELLSHKNGEADNYFFQNIGLSCSDKYLSIKLFLYNKNKKFFSEDLTSINQGKDLTLTEDVVWISPIITLTGGSAKIYGIRFLPLNTPFSHGLLQTKNWVSCWLKNNNNSLSLLKIEEIIRRYLIPYNCSIRAVELSSAASSSEEEGDSFSWIGGGQYCERFVWAGVEEASYCEQTEG